jgi:polynucleotide 5'-hydroxyl-kinase GRC3/NOL9
LDDQTSITVSDTWSALKLTSLGGVLLVLGAPDTGKTTFAHWLSDRLAQGGCRAALLDGDIGQSALGPPAALTLALPGQTSQVSRDWHLIHWFIGDVSPRGRMLPLVVGAGRLTQRALEAGVEAVVVDTTGLVDRARGGVALKHALVDQLQPTTIFAFQRSSELEPILGPLRRLSCPQLVELPVLDVVRRRGVETRREHRARAFRSYFAGAGKARLPLRERAIFDGQTFAPRRLLALQDAAGFALALGVILQWDRASHVLIIRTPLTEMGDVASVRLGAIGVDVQTGREIRPGRGNR